MLVFSLFFYRSDSVDVFSKKINSFWVKRSQTSPQLDRLPSKDYKMKKLGPAVFLTTVLFLVAQVMAEEKSPTTETESVTPVSVRPFDRRPSFWTKTANQLKASTQLRSYKPYANRTLFHRKYLLSQENGLKPIHELRLRRRLNKAKAETGNLSSGNTVLKSPEDLEDKIMKDESFIGLKEFAKSLINETTKYFTKKKNSLSRSYPIEDPQSQHQLWDDKDQTYHASTFSNVEYEPTSFHHHYIPPPPIHYFPPQKKDDALLAKVALIALLKLILAKLKAIGFLKLMMFFLMKLPIMFFKFLFILKSFKVLKLISIPFLMASFAAPFLPLIPFFAPLLFFPMLFFPLFLPLMLPLLFFLPIVPVTTPVTAAASTRTRRDALNVAKSVNSSDWSLMDEKWKTLQTNNTRNRARYFRARGRPVTFENKNSDTKSGFDNPLTKFGMFNQYEEPTKSANLLELTQKVVESQQCIQRIACELATQNDSKIYQSAVIWALGKVQSLAPERIKKKIEKYSEAYQTGSKKKSSEFCQQRFHCQRPKIYIVQGKAKYNVF